jgi:HK97 family phage prohead protease/HK97 family phage major capsid protein
VVTKSTDLRNKVFHVTSQFQKDMPLPTTDGKIDSIYIEGYANTNNVDRSGDVIPSTVWEAGVENYLKNPIILAYHDHDEPIGRMEDYKIDTKGLWVRARISAAAEDVFNLIKDGVLSAFSVGFYIKDAMYDAVTDLFIIKELELCEISVVSVPCNQDSIFEVAKSFATLDDYKLFKQQFASKGTSANGPTTKEAFISTPKEKLKMDEKELQALLAKATQEAATKALADRDAQEAATKAAAEAKAAEEARITSIVKNQLEVGQSGAERLLADITKRFEDQEVSMKSALDGLQADIKEKTAELKAIQDSKMSFKGNEKEAVSYAEKEAAVLLSVITQKGLGDTKYGRAMLEKAGAHVPGAVPWEQEVSLNLEQAIRARLVVAPIFRSLDMKTNVMKLPLNPEAGLGTWVTNAQFGTSNSAGATQVHQLQEVTLNAYKIATQESLAFEEEEDSLVVLTPIIRDGMVRRLARGIDRAYLRGAGSGADPIQGVSLYDATSIVTPTNTGSATIAHMRALRKDLGIYGLDPADVIFVVSTECYYDLLEDTQFQAMNQVGPLATLLTGQIGQIGNSPVLVSAEFSTKAGGAATASTNIGAIAVATRNFLAGNQRGLRFDTQDLAYEQRRVMVASMRTGLTQITPTYLGAALPGVSTLRWS